MQFLQDWGIGLVIFGTDCRSETSINMFSKRKALLVKCFKQLLKKAQGRFGLGTRAELRRVGSRAGFPPKMQWREVRYLSNVIFFLLEGTFVGVVYHVYREDQIKGRGI